MFTISHCHHYRILYFARVIGNERWLSTRAVPPCDIGCGSLAKTSFLLTTDTSSTDGYTNSGSPPFLDTLLCLQCRNLTSTSSSPRRSRISPKYVANPILRAKLTIIKSPFFNIALSTSFPNAS
jgi:hypothetical protein